MISQNLLILLFVSKFEIIPSQKELTKDSQTTMIKKAIKKYFEYSNAYNIAKILYLKSKTLVQFDCI